MKNLCIHNMFSIHVFQSRRHNKKKGNIPLSIEVTVTVSVGFAAIGTSTAIAHIC